MDNYDIYNDIATRTGGDIYIGVVGPVRSGKSTLVKKLTEKLILPNIASKNKKKIAVDETPQTAAGKTVMTTEPKFVPSEAVAVSVGKAQAKIRLIDCVGYMVDGAFFADEDGKPRLVKTPWSEEDIPFERAAEIGTEKVIKEHSTIGLVVTSDGSFTDIARSAYAAVEDRVIDELKSINKPFIVLLNTVDPTSAQAKRTCAEIEKKHDVSVIAVNAENMGDGDIENALVSVLKEFPLVGFDVDLPKWMQAIPADDEAIQGVIASITAAGEKVFRMKDVSAIEKAFVENEDFGGVDAVSMDMGSGRAKITVSGRNGLFYKVLSRQCGEDITDEFSVMNYVNSLAVAKREYIKLKTALDGADADGYGVSLPLKGEIEYENAEVRKTVGGYGVKMRARAECVHIIKTPVTADVALISGTKEQCENFVESMNGEKGAEVLVFGRNAFEIVDEGIAQKCNSLALPVRQKIKRTLSKAVNEKKSNLICFLI